MNKLLIAGFLVLLVIGVCGCDTKESDQSLKDSQEIQQEQTKEPEIQLNDKTKEPEIQLNDRQKRILAEKGLPDSYEQLSYNQKKAIVSIEEMLQYAEGKYQMAFCYAGYGSDDPVYGECLHAYPEGMDMKYDSFLIWRTDTGYEDTYMNMVVAEPLEEYLGTLVQDLHEGTDIKIFVNAQTALEKLPDQPEQFDGAVDGSWVIFVDSNYPVEKVKELGEQIASRLQVHRIYGDLQVVGLTEGTLPYVTRYNFSDYFDEAYCTARESIYIQPISNVEG